jgi:hypothetical protein
MLIQAEIFEQITQPATRFKELISRRLPDNFVLDQDQFPEHIYNVAFETLCPVLTGYSPDYRFRSNNIYYDSKARPVEHMRSFYQLALVFIELELTAFNCFPLRSTLG